MLRSFFGDELTVALGMAEGVGAVRGSDIVEQAVTKASSRSKNLWIDVLVQPSHPRKLGVEAPRQPAANIPVDLQECK